MSSENRDEQRAIFIKRFIDTLGDVRYWEHTGEIIELPYPTGHCVCGHAIKFLFPIVKKNAPMGSIYYIGSECIKHFKNYSPELYESLMATIEREDAKAKAEREQILNDLLAVSQGLYAELCKKLRSKYSDKYGSAWCPEKEVWYAVHKDFRDEPSRQMKTVSGLFRWYERKTTELQIFLGNHPDLA